MRRVLAGIAVLGTLALPAAAQATTFTVTTVADSPVGDDDCLVAACTLRQAITAANASFGLDTVRVPAGSYVLANGQLESTEGLVLGRSGAGTVTIDAGGQSRALLLSGPTAISDMTITGGAATDSPTDPAVARGGGIYAAAALELVDVTVADSSATSTSAEGGGVYVLGRPAFDDVTITDNAATSAATGHATGGGVDIAYSGPFDVSGLTVRDNRAAGGDGGASGGGLNSSDNGMRLWDSTFTANTARASGTGSAFGGGVFSSAGRIESTRVSGSTSLSEGAYARGGGIAATGDLEVVASTIDDNLVFSDGTAGTSAEGGGVYGLAGALTITNTTIVDNLAQALSGASVAGGGVMYSDGTVLTATTITGNRASDSSGSLAGYGGGIAQTLSGSSVTVRGTILAGNDQDTGGDCGDGTVHSDGGNVLNVGASCTYVPATGDVTATDPGLASLADNGGPTPTMLPQAGSPALDRYAAASGGCFGLTTDQRGVARPQGGACDAGAVEVVAPPTPAPSTTPSTPSAPVDAGPAPSVQTPSAAAPRTCPSRRVTVRLNPRGVHFVRARVSVDGVLIRAHRDRTRWTASFQLKGDPGQKVRVTVRGRRADGRLLTRTRTLTVC
jgi:CSLREA domain-containing protein